MPKKVNLPIGGEFEVPDGFEFEAVRPPLFDEWYWNAWMRGAIQCSVGGREEPRIILRKIPPVVVSSATTGLKVGTWVARDEDGGLFVYSDKPYRDINWRRWLAEFGYCKPLDRGLFKDIPQVTFENSPIPVTE